MDIYVVGGAVRDRLLGLPVKDKDHVVVGATPEQLSALGYRPVGKDFPVFLHPHTHEEYALARTERKTAPGYTGFVFHAAPDVTLAEDLRRRDLTVNAIAEAADGSLIDPYGGQRDLAARVLRHVSPAFAEDPVRILRVARFAARFDGFTIAPETMALMRAMVAAGEVDALVPERVWQEMARGLMATQPWTMFAVLQQCGALGRLAPALVQLWGGEAMPPAVQAALAHCVQVQAGLAVRYAALVAGATALAPAERGAAIEALSQHLRVPRECCEIATMAARENTLLRQARTAETVVALFERCDALRKPQRFNDMLTLYPQHGAALSAALAQVRQLDAGAVAARTVAAFPGQPQKIAEALHQARVATLAVSGLWGQALS